MNRTRLFTSQCLVALCVALTSIVSSATAEGLAKVETKSVCMINNKVFPRDQIPTVVEGRTYYGCCEMCASRLSSDVAVRKAVDPVSGKEVDKATAIIGADQQGRAFYFESEKNLKAFSPKEG